MRPALLANLLIVGSGAGALAAEGFTPDLYYAVAQEDGPLEWASFWAFFGAAGAGAWAAIRNRRQVPWCETGFALLCLFIALEEISWGQRLFGYRPPSYFLEHNFQQEFNLHNVVDTGLRKLGLQGLTLGYGVALPLLLLFSPIRSFARRLRVFAPPLALAPAFLATGLLYLWYPIHLTGEVVEFMLGCSLLFVALAPEPYDAPEHGNPLLCIGSAAILVAGLGGLSAYVGNQPRADSERIAQARLEVDALAADLHALAASERRRYVPRCGIHKRMFSFVRKYGVELPPGKFSAAMRESKTRARYFIDPWNSPYWIRHKCLDDRHYAFIYSFGPDRGRDSSRTEILGDDVGALIDPASSR